ncbi:MAG TPA: hypothetical protein VFY71_17075 [Planctomycetota bacterium]|nr:hypothetical protein [Planctomycetota bacterium]
MRPAWLLALLCLAPAAPSSTLVVPVPPEIHALARPGGTRFWALGADGTLVDGIDDDTSVSFALPEGGVADRVLLVGGPAARWAHLGDDGAWSWDTQGFIVAGRVPPELADAYVDILRPLDGQVAPPVDALYPTFSDAEISGQFTIGVPAPGRYELVLDANHGKRRALATCEAVPEDAFVGKELPLVETRAVDLRLVLTPPTSLAKGVLPPLLARELYARSDLDVPLAVERTGKTLTAHVAPRLMGGRLWVWSPGWRALLVEGSAFNEEHPVVERKAEAGRKLLVRVRDPAGGPIGIACVELQDAAEKPIVAAWDPRGDETAARLDVAGRVGPSGEITVFGLPEGGLTVVAGRCAEGREPGVAEWDGKAPEITVTVE